MGTAFSTIRAQKKYNKKNDETRKSDSNIHIPTFSSRQVIVQPKLDCTEAGDMYEREADLMADYVTNLSFAAGADGGKSRPSRVFSLGHFISRLASNPSGIQIDEEMESKIKSSHCGEPLPNVLRSRMESSFGADFSGVRIHTDNKVAEMNTNLHSKAFTYGQDIFLGRGEFSPGTKMGQHLIAHELTHTLQQSDMIGRKPKNEFDFTEEMDDSKSDFTSYNLSGFQDSDFKPSEESFFDDKSTLTSKIRNRHVKKNISYLYQRLSNLYNYHNAQTNFVERLHKKHKGIAKKVFPVILPFEPYPSILLFYDDFNLTTIKKEIQKLQDRTQKLHNRNTEDKEKNLDKTAFDEKIQNLDTSLDYLHAIFEKRQKELCDIDEGYNRFSYEFEQYLMNQTLDLANYCSNVRIPLWQLKLGLDKVLQEIQNHNEESLLYDLWVSDDHFDFMINTYTMLSESMYTCIKYCESLGTLLLYYATSDYYKNHSLKDFLNEKEKLVSIIKNYQSSFTNYINNLVEFDKNTKQKAFWTQVGIDIAASIALCLIPGLGAAAIVGNTAKALGLGARVLIGVGTGAAGGTLASAGVQLIDIGLTEKKLEDFSGFDVSYGALSGGVAGGVLRGTGNFIPLIANSLLKPGANAVIKSLGVGFANTGASVIADFAGAGASSLISGKDMNFNWTEEFIVNAIFSAFHARSVYKNYKKDEFRFDKDMHTNYEELINPTDRDEFRNQLSDLYVKKASDTYNVNRSALQEIAHAFKNPPFDKNNIKGKITGFFNNLKQIKSDRDLSLKIINASFDSDINNILTPKKEILYIMQIQEGKSWKTALKNAYSEKNLVDDHIKEFENLFNKITYGITDNLGKPNDNIYTITSNVIPNITQTSPKESYKQQVSDQEFNLDNSIGAASNDTEAVKALLELFALDEVPENTEELKLINEQINSLNDPTLNTLIILSKNYDKVIDES